MNQQQTNNTNSLETEPWYKQFWPWFIIALPVASVIASFTLLWLAISRPDPVILEDQEYRQVKSELKAQTPQQEAKQDKPGDSGGTPN